MEKATIRTVMNSNLITVKPDTLVSFAIGLLVEHEISGLPVVDEKRRIVGVLTEKDLLKMFYEEASEIRQVRSLMTRNPHTISVNAPLVEVFDSLMTHDFRRVLIDDRGKLVGLVSRADLMPTILDVLLERG